MAGNDQHLDKLRKWIGKAKTIDEPPQAGDEIAKRTSDQVVQLNLKVAPALKRRMKHLATRDDINLATLLQRMLDLYEKEQGALPEFPRKAR